MNRLAACLTAVLLLPASSSAGADPLPVDGRENLNAVLWMQTAHEYAFSTAQVYATAGRLLVEAGSLPSALVDGESPVPVPDAPPAIVLDLDETVLTTSRYAASLLAAGRRHKIRPQWRWWDCSSEIFQPAPPADPALLCG
jgi:acid phosphatase